MVGAQNSQQWGITRVINNTYHLSERGRGRGRGRGPGEGEDEDEGEGEERAGGVHKTANSQHKKRDQHSGCNNCPKHKTRSGILKDGTIPKIQVCERICQCREKFTNKQPTVAHKSSDQQHWKLFSYVGLSVGFVREVRRETTTIN